MYAPHASRHVTYAIIRQQPAQLALLDLRSHIGIIMLALMLAAVRSAILSIIRTAPAIPVRVPANNVPH